MKSRKITLTIESDFEHVAMVGMSVNAICSSVIGDKETLFHLELCVVEAVNNCIMHAYGKQSGQFVEIVVELLPRCIIFQVSDTGKSMGALSENLVDIDRQLYDMSSLPERGRGLFIIHKLMDDVTYTGNGQKNTLTMRKILSR